MSWGSMNNIGAQLGWGIIEEGWRKGPWTAEEDRLLMEYVRLHGEGRWNSVARLAGLRRNGKSCRLRWVNYLRPDLKRGQITPHEESIILELHARWGNRWSTIARSLPGRTDNEIKNYWRTHFKKKTKISSNNKSDNKAKNRLLIKRQQLQRQQQQSHQQQQHQHQQSEETQLINQLDMNKIMSLLEDQNEDRAPHYVQAQSRQQEMANGTIPVTSEEQGFFYSVPNNANGTNISEPISEEILWDGLWNLDDFHGNFGASCATSKASLHNFVSPFFLS